ncbi:hypothetical protein BJX68DRAFT_231698 [Aspergillus pseudodeflectus]|uniref:Uncharacterized protein n=1 Tax=Aspergillus pseudodeflectus TaxID=176178 RepID=A0ABR4KVD8_9EURO
MGIRPNWISKAGGHRLWGLQHGERFKWSQVRLCRSSFMTGRPGTSPPDRPYQVLSPSEFRAVLDQIEGANEMLSACQTEHVQSPWEDAKARREVAANYTK